MERLPIEHIIGRGAPLATEEAIKELVRENAHNICRLLSMEQKWRQDHSFVLAMAREITQRRGKCGCSSPHCAYCPRARHKQLFALVSKHLWRDFHFCEDLVRIGPEWWHVLPYHLKRSKRLRTARLMLALIDYSVMPRPKRPHERVRRAKRSPAGWESDGA